MDNLSEISAELSDAMCRIATGGSFRTRKLRTDNDELILTYRRPLIINSIEELPQRPDLLDRCLLIHLEPIPEDLRRDEHEFWAEFEEARPRLLGGLLDVISEGLRRIEGVQLPVMPRMADFARWGVAVEEALGYRSGDFVVAYCKNIEQASDVALESSPIASLLRDFLTRCSSFRGPTLTLLNLLNEFDSDTADTARKHPRWPKAANALSREITRIEPNLAKWGITVQRGSNHREGRWIALTLTKRDAAKPHVVSSPDAA